ncbi:MAG TPA: alpha/beta hydrolase domain-containing protein [Spirillospora sp.]|nr:alpha/beta hydrolase domain-containing protein [Spirillospora sp.]
MAANRPRLICHSVAKKVLATLPALALAVPSLQAPPVRADAPADVPSPVISVPPRGDHGFPFMAESENLAAQGYVEREFFLKGTATAYQKSGTWTSDGRWAVKPASRAAYKTRILVRRPAQQSRFNGTVLVEWLNDTGTLDTTPDWSYAHDELLRAGYAWVGVSAQQIGITAPVGMRTWDSARYSALAHPGDAYSYDIFSQAAKALRAPNGPKPLGNLRASKFIGDGESQSAVRMATYVNAVAPLARMFDGYLVHSNASFAAPLAAGYIDLSFPTARIRTDLKAPTFLLATESDVGLNAAARQPDSATVHTWEITGSAHADRWMFDQIAPTVRRSIGVPVQLDLACGTDAAPVNDGPGHYAADAALAALDRWMREGPAPAAGTPITLAGGRIVRDPATGLARGGVRLPDVTVPTRTLSGQRGGGITGLICTLFGASDPRNGDADPWDNHDDADPSNPASPRTPEPVLTRLYPTPAAYIAKVSAAASSAVRRGFLTPEDATRLIKKAQQTQW